jgi:hypothetical protein
MVSAMVISLCTIGAGALGVDDDPDLVVDQIVHIVGDYPASGIVRDDLASGSRGTAQATRRK